jgi:hypothetical protein
LRSCREREGGEDKDDARKATGERKKIQRLLDEANGAMKALDELHGEVTTKWGHLSQRILGHIVRSPPITLGTGMESFTEDYAVVEFGSSKIEKAFSNVIDLSTF